MEKITRLIQRKRSETFTQTFPFTTYEIIFASKQGGFNDDFWALLQYLKKVFFAGIPHREQSASKMPELDLKVQEHFTHKYSDFARSANYKGAGNRQHSIVENYFMDNHSDCLAIEFPMCNDKMSAFGDILLYEDNQIKILDFKPNAKKEKKAPTQLYYNRELLSEMTGIDRKYISCYYFDDISCFEVLFTN